MADNNTIARPYAQAIFDIAKDTASMEMWSEGLMIAKEYLRTAI